jgi:membrane protease YdiL (CAAX protease family)
MGSFKLVVEFVVLAYLLAFLVDFVFYAYGLTFSFPMTTTSITTALWGFTRMWSVAFAVFICLILRGVSVKSWLRGKLGFKRNTIKYYFTAPLIPYFALGVYVAIAYPLGLFDFKAYVEVIKEYLTSAGSIQGFSVEELAWIIAIVQVFQAYIAAVTINALAALGEEIGWRGYLFELLGGRPSPETTAVIGVLWGLWHASAILLMGYNYTYNRALGALLFVAFATAVTYPHLYITKKTGSLWPASSLHGGVNALRGLTEIATRLPLEQREILLGLGAMGILTWTITTLTILSASKQLENKDSIRRNSYS